MLTQLLHLLKGLRSIKFYLNKGKGFWVTKSRRKRIPEFYYNTARTSLYIFGLVCGTSSEEPLRLQHKGVFSYYRETIC